MSFSLSFSPEFFLATGEPYDRADLALNADGEPFSVYSAIAMMQMKRKRDWNRMAREVFGCKGEHLSAETVLDKIHETDSCGQLHSPVDVWIDSEGHYRVDVHEATHYTYCSGMSGYMPDNSGTARTRDDAIACVLGVFEDQLSGRELKRARKALRDDGIYYFSKRAQADGIGAQYCEISEERGECPEND